MKKLLFLLILLIPFCSWAQERVLTFGIQYKPMIPISLIESTTVESVNDGVKFTNDQKFGYAAGFLIRKGITDKFSIETGISYVKRNYSLSIDSLNGNYSTGDDFGIVGYEIPVVGLVYIQLSREVYMNVSMGGTFDVYPSDVSNANEIKAGDWLHVADRRNWLQISALANIGWEYRTKESGIFYLGASYHRPFDFAYLSKYGVFKSVGVSRVSHNQELGGNYLTLDFRYFFHEDPEKRKLKKKKKSRK